MTSWKLGKLLTPFSFTSVILRGFFIYSFIHSVTKVPTPSPSMSDVIYECFLRSDSQLLSRDLNNRLVWHSSHEHLYNHRIVCYLDHGLNSKLYQVSEQNGPPFRW